MKILIDMNLSPDWVSTFEINGIESMHWSQIGKQDASYMEIFTYARNHNYAVFTHDLDFGDILAATSARSPSVIQVRTENTAPKVLYKLFLKAIQQFGQHLDDGALITIDPDKLRARILPIEDMVL